VKGDWITFSELCERWPSKSARTLRRYIKDRLISYRQVRRNCPLEFNWHTVERELRVLESRGVLADAAENLPEQISRAEFTLLNDKLDRVLELMERKAS
jgi:hypothetical protein